MVARAALFDAVGNERTEKLAGEFGSRGHPRGGGEPRPRSGGETPGCRIFARDRPS